MLRLTIQNYALIDCLIFLFRTPCHILVNGAGKSILLGALSLVLGGRSDISTLKDRTRNCVVEAIYLEEAECILRRVSPAGRSTFIDDEPTTLVNIKNLPNLLWISIRNIRIFFSFRIPDFNPGSFCRSD